jgi:hypothetical protein
MHPQSIKEYPLALKELMGRFRKKRNHLLAFRIVGLIVGRPTSEPGAPDRKPRPWQLGRAGVSRGGYRPFLCRRACARSDAAAFFALELLFFEARVLPAADAAFLPVTLLLPRWARSEAAACLAALEAAGDRRVFPAAEAAFFEVLPLLAMVLAALPVFDQIPLSIIAGISKQGQSLLHLYSTGYSDLHDPCT